MRGNFTLALIAHNNKKDALADFALEHRSALRYFHLIATLGTGTTIQKRTGLPISMLEHGPLGGDQQIGALTAAHEVQAAIFFRDPITVAPHEPDFAEWLRVCDELEIPLATNRSSAEALIYFLQNSPNRTLIAARPWGFVLPLAEAASAHFSGTKR